MRRFVWVLTISVFSLFGMYLSGSLIMFWDLTSLFMVALPTAGAVFSVYGTKIFTADAKTINKAIRLAIFASIFSSTFSVFVGGVVIAANLTDPSAIGPGIAVMILPWMYAMFLSMVLCCFKRDDSDSSQESSRFKAVA